MATLFDEVLMKKERNILQYHFFNRDASTVAKDLLGKIIRKYNGNIWLSAQIIETEAYYSNEKGSHASLGYSEKRKALFMPPGTIYMYYSRGKDSLNFSCKGKGNAVLIKSGIPHNDVFNNNRMIKIMQSNNPLNSGLPQRLPMKLCSGQTLLCRSLSLTVRDWDQKQLDENSFFIEDTGIRPKNIIVAKRLGIPPGRDDHLLYRFIDYDHVEYCTKNPLTVKNNQVDKNYLIIKNA